MATAPSGSGWVTIPTIVPMKIDSRCHAWVETPAGCGANHNAVARPTEMARLFMSAPHWKPGAGACVALAATAELAVAAVLWPRLLTSGGLM